MQRNEIERSDDSTEAGGTGTAVNERHAIQEEGRRESAEHEVLEAGFLALGPLSVACCQHIERNRQCLESEEQHNEVVRHDHRDSADNGHDVEPVNLRAVHTFASHEVVGDQRHQNQRHANNDDAEHREMVIGQCVADDEPRTRLGNAAPLHADDHDGGYCDGDGTQRIEVLWPRWRQGCGDEQHEATAEQNKQRCNGEPVDSRGDKRNGGEVHGCASCDVETGCGST